MAVAAVDISFGKVRSILQCAQKCYNDMDCQSFFYKRSGLCLGSQTILNDALGCSFESQTKFYQYTIELAASTGTTTMPEFPPAPTGTTTSVPEFPPASTGTTTMPEFPPAPTGTTTSVPELPPASTGTTTPVPEFPPAPTATTTSVPEFPSAPTGTTTSVPEFPPAPTGTISIPSFPDIPTETIFILSYGMPCISDADCLQLNTYCYKLLCECNPGYSFHYSTLTCTNGCDIYGSTYITYLYKMLDDGILYKSMSVLQCIITCEALNCRSFSYNVLLADCTISNETAVTLPTAFLTSSPMDYYNRNCA